MAEANRRLAPLYIKGPGYEEFVVALTEIAYAACEHGRRPSRHSVNPLTKFPAMKNCGANSWPRAMRALTRPRPPSVN